MKKEELKPCITDHCFVISLNANDTFGYACAESHDVELFGLSVLKFAFNKYGAEGITAFMSFERGYLPIREHRTKEFYTALKGIKNHIKTYPQEYRKYYRQELLRKRRTP